MPRRENVPRWNVVVVEAFGAADPDLIEVILCEARQRLLGFKLVLDVPGVAIENNEPILERAVTMVAKDEAVVKFVSVGK